ncbi:hypothetical protein SAMN05444483_12230 [Salegentibacter echinorum]|uniref:Uncharacterized protein n=1 Tax=Salegentibacter echinorum TaxID=1073325 RepID=A0A1M5LXC4_SALEC|nr:hypothetical protein SAMN05444483_12230 [Salegentibacter echinorum]
MYSRITVLSHYQINTRLPLRYAHRNDDRCNFGRLSPSYELCDDVIAKLLFWQLKQSPFEISNQRIPNHRISVLSLQHITNIDIRLPLRYAPRNDGWLVWVGYRQALGHYTCDSLESNKGFKFGLPTPDSRINDSRITALSHQLSKIQVYKALGSR